MLVGFTSGDIGTLSLTVGSVSNIFGYLGYDARSSGTATVSSGSWTSRISLHVGFSGTGVLNLTGSCVVQVGSTGTGTGVVNFNHTGSSTFAPTLTGTLSINKLGPGTTTLTGANTYTGGTTVSAGVLRLDATSALPGGIDTAVGAGESALTLDGGVLGLGAGDFTRDPGTGSGQVQFTAGGGFAAYTADRLVNLGGASAAVTWGVGGFVPSSSNLILGAADATHTVVFQNPINLGGAVRTVRVDDGSAAIDGRLTGALTSSAGGGLTKTGTGTLNLDHATQSCGSVSLS